MVHPHRSIPVIKPNPPRLSAHVLELAELERSGIYSNFGPVNRTFEEALVDEVFGTGHCLTVCNATVGLMVAIRQVIDHAFGEHRPPQRRYALMPSFTFAATAHAALWNGLTPLFCDIDPETWLPSQDAEDALLDRYRDEIAVVVPYATFGNNLDLRRYDRIADRWNLPIVVDAAASLGSLDEHGRAFGTAFRWPVVFSMHATKTFATGEGGVIYCADERRLAQLRAMCSFGFEAPRVATLLGLNAKLSEVAALTALLQLQRFPRIVKHRQDLANAYRKHLPEWSSQQLRGIRQSHAFQSVLLPDSLASNRPQVLEALREQGVGASTYFSPHLAEQPYFARHSVTGPLPVTTDVANRIVTLPMFDDMTEEDIVYVAATLTEIVEECLCQSSL